MRQTRVVPRTPVPDQGRGFLRSFVCCLGKRALSWLGSILVCRVKNRLPNLHKSLAGMIWACARRAIGSATLISIEEENVCPNRLII